MLGILAAPAGATARPDVSQLLVRYQAARGGEDAWKAIQTLGYTGHIVSKNVSTPELSFLMLLHRPNALRFEIAGKGERSIRIFDGQNGWRVRPGSERGLEIHAYDADELNAARDSGGLDGPLSDPDSKGIHVALEGADQIEGHRAWRLRVTLPSGQVQQHWLDAKTYLELRYDRTSHDGSGKPVPVSVYYRNYRTFADVKVPLDIETRTAQGQLVNQMIVDKVAVNPHLDASTFVSPSNVPHHGGVVVDATRAR
ncbi:MAG: hypothetical protein JSR66_17425 [Proteobacteria bacterium]|nr:hypothetical protein [Pseudomonadota bacterium]